MMASVIAACGGSSSTTTTAGAAAGTTTGGTTATTAAAPTGGTLKIGFVSPLTGEASSFGVADPYILDLATKALAGGISVGDKTYGVQFLAKDGQSNPQRAAEVAQGLINSDGIDLMLTTSTPEVINPVSDACEAAGVPCISTTCPWEAWVLGRGAKLTDTAPFKFTYIFSFGSQQFTNAFLSGWPQVPTNKKVGAMWPNDADGNAIRASIGPALVKAGYTIVDPGAYTDGSNDYSTQITKFKSENCQIIQGFPLPPDWATFMRQAAQQGYFPKITQWQKAATLESDMEALGAISNNVATGLYWSAAWPYTWATTGMTAKQLGDGWTTQSGKYPHPQLGGTAALIDVGIAALKASGDPKNKQAVADAMKTLSVDTALGKLTWGTGPNANVVPTPIINGQWIKSTGKSKFEWVIVENANDKNIPVQATLQPYTGS